MVQNRSQRRMSNNQNSEIKVNGTAANHKSTKTRGHKRALESDTEAQPKKSKVALEMPPISDGILLTVGMGDVGQLGLGEDVEEKTRPAVVPTLGEVVAISAGGLHTVCLNKEGKVFSWGCNDEGALGRITTTEEENFVKGEVKIDGDVVQLTAGDCHTSALTSDGKVFAWGSFRDNSGPLGFVEADTIQKTPRRLLEGVPIVKIESGNSHSVFLAQSGHLYTCGNGESGQLGRIAEMFACRDSRNRNGVESLLTPRLVKTYNKRKLVLFDDVWAGGLVTFAKARDTGEMYGFGLNNYCQLGDVNTNLKFQPFLLKAFKGKDWKMIACGLHHSLALDSKGKVYSMGRKEYGRLGLGEDTEDAQVPTLVKKLADKTCISISAGECMSLAVTKSGVVYGFGMGTSNQLAQGDEEDRWNPTPLGGKQLATRKVLAADAGGQHTVILAKNK